MRPFFLKLTKTRPLGRVRKQGEVASLALGLALILAGPAQGADGRSSGPSASPGSTASVASTNATANATKAPGSSSAGEKPDDTHQLAVGDRVSFRVIEDK